MHISPFVHACFFLFLEIVKAHEISKVCITSAGLVFYTKLI